MAVGFTSSAPRITFLPAVSYQLPIVGTSSRAGWIILQNLKGNRRGLMKRTDINTERYRRCP
jgi:hypothetical protein